MNLYGHVVHICLFYNACAMAEDNTYRIKLWCVSQTKLVRRERVAARITRPRVTDNSFDDASTLQAWSSSSHSRLSKAFLEYDATKLENPKAHVDPKVQEETDHDTSLGSYLRGSYDTSLLYNYAEHASMHVWNGEVYFFSFAIHILSTN